MKLPSLCKVTLDEVPQFVYCVLKYKLIKQGIYLSTILLDHSHIRFLDGKPVEQCCNNFVYCLCFCL